MELPGSPPLCLPQGRELAFTLAEQFLTQDSGPFTCIPLQQAGVFPAAPSCCANAAFQFLWLSFLLVLTQGFWDLQRKGDEVSFWSLLGPICPPLIFLFPLVLLPP